MAEVFSLQVHWVTALVNPDSDQAGTRIERFLLLLGYSPVAKENVPRRSEIIGFNYPADRYTDRHEGRSITSLADVTT